jgi:hypothetical protein
MSEIKALKKLAIPICVVFAGFILWNMGSSKQSDRYAFGHTLSADELLISFQFNARDACSDNKYNIPEADCIALVNNKSPVCRKQTADKFPGKINTIERMILVGHFFSSCVFEGKESSTQP